MKAISLTLKGFRGIRDGLRRDEVTLDFSALAGGASLVAFKGPNGRGKTTIMDNMHPYPVMPSRAGADGLGSFSFYDQVVLSENVKDLVWEHQEQRYRTQMVFRVNGKKKTEAYLHILRDGNWTPVRLDDGTVSDGKVDTYVRCVEGVLGSQETFFTSAFSAQGKRQLTSFKNAEIKSLMADLLGHEEIRQIGAQGSETAKLLKVGLTTIRQELSTLQAEEGQNVVKRAALGDLTVRISNSEVARAATKAAVESAAHVLAKARAEQDMAAQTEARRTQLTADQRTVVEEGRTTLGQFDDQDKREGERLSEVDRRIARRIQDAQAKRQTLDAQANQLQRTLAARSAVNRAQTRLALSEAVVAGRDAQLTRRRAAVERIDILVATERTSVTRLATIEREAGQAALRAKELATRLGLATEVPCAGTDLQGQCKLLGDAMEAKILKPSADLEISRLQEEKIRESEHLVDVRAELTELLATLCATTPAAAKASVAVIQAKISAARARLSRLSVLAARRGEVEQAATSLAAVVAELATLNDSAAVETPEEAAERANIIQARESILAQRTVLSGQYRTRYDQLAEQLKALPAPVDATELRNAEQAVASAQAAASSADNVFMTAIRDQQLAAQLDQRITEIRAQVDGIRERLQGIEQQLSTWTLFAKCMSNDGVIALLIDDAGPTLSGLANDLLLACYGPRFTVSIKTQVETGKGELREGFDIVVHDADSGDSKSVTQMSGGERVWINECMTRAIALYLAQNSGRRYGTLFCDEADGALDPDRKRMFMAMKREVLRLGGYEQEFFVSQTPELTAMADAVIDLDQFMNYSK